MTTFMSACAVVAFVGCTGATTSPTVGQVTYCRNVMYIQSDLEIVPLGYCLEDGFLDATIRFKFIAKTADPASLFDAAYVDPTTFVDDLDPPVFNQTAGETWWDLSSQHLSGATFIVPPPNSKGSRGLNIAYTDNHDGTLTVYVLWFET